MSDAAAASQKQRRAAIITAAGDLARSGRYPVEGIIAALEKAGFNEARAVLVAPHLSSGLLRLVEGARQQRS